MASSASARGIPGEPPPEPTSIRSGRGGRLRAAASGSMMSLSRASSRSFKDVRLIVRFQWTRRS